MKHELNSSELDELDGLSRVVMLQLMGTRRPVRYDSEGRRIVAAKTDFNSLWLRWRRGDDGAQHIETPVFDHTKYVDWSRIGLKRRHHGQTFIHRKKHVALWDNHILWTIHMNQIVDERFGPAPADSPCWSGSMFHLKKNDNGWGRAGRVCAAREDVLTRIAAGEFSEG